MSAADVTTAEWLPQFEGVHFQSSAASRAPSAVGSERPQPTLIEAMMAEPSPGEAIRARTMVVRGPQHGNRQADPAAILSADRRMWGPWHAVESRNNMTTL